MCPADYSAWSAEGLEASRRKVKVDLASHRRVRLATYEHRTLFCLEMCAEPCSKKVITVETAALQPAPFRDHDDDDDESSVDF